MKPSLRLTKIIFAACSLSFASAAFSAPKTPTPTPPASDEEEVDPATITIPGTVIERPAGKGYLSLTLEGGTLKLNFYDAKKQAVAPDVARAAAHWQPKQKISEDRTVLNPTSDGQALLGAKFVQPPFPLTIFITLLNADGIGVENHTVVFRP